MKNSKILLSILLLAILVFTFTPAFAEDHTNIITNPIQIPVGENPSHIAVNNSTNTIFVSNSDSNTVSAINGNDYSDVQTIPVGNYPYDIAVNHITNTIYAANILDSKISVIDGDNYSDVQIIDVGYRPYAIAVNHITNTIYAANMYDNTVSAINGNDYSDVQVIDVGYSPYDIAVNHITNTIYVSNYNSGNISIINGDDYSDVQTITAGELPTGELPTDLTFIDTTGNGDVDTHISNFPTYIAVNHITNTIYVASDNRFVSVINGNDYSDVQSIDVDFNPIDIAVNPITNTIHLTSYHHDLIVVIDGTNNLVIGSTILGVTGDMPYAIAVNPNTNTIYVTNLGDNTVSVIDGDDYSYMDKAMIAIPVGNDPGHIAVNNSTNTIYVVNSDDDTVSAIIGDNYSDVQTIPVGNDPGHIAVNHITNTIYVTNNDDRTVSAINGNDYSDVQTIPVGYKPIHLAINYITNTIYVVNSDRTVSIINGDNYSDVQSVDVGISPTNIAINLITNTIFVSNSDSNTVSAINGDNYSDVQSIPVGDTPMRIVVNPITNTIYVTNYDSNIVSAINGDNYSDVQSIPVGKYSHAIAINPITNTIYVTNESDETILAINGDNNSVVQTIDASNGPYAIAINHITNMIYITNSESDTVSVINGNDYSDVQSILVGNDPRHIAVNSITDMVYVSNSGDDTVSVIGISGSGGGSSGDITPPTFKKSSGGCADCTPPTFGVDKNNVLLVSDGFTYNGVSTDVDFYHTEFPLITVLTNATNTVTVKVYENQGVYNIKMVQFGLGMPEVGSPLQDAQSLVEISLSGIDVDEINIIDPNNLVDIIGVSTSVVNCNVDGNTECLELTLQYVYRDQPKYNVMAINAIDNSRNGQTNYLNDGILVTGESLNEPLLQTTISSNAGAFYPQRAGTVELTLLDYKTDIWEDEYGYKWSSDTYGPYMIDDIPAPQQPTNAYSAWSGYNDRVHSEFAAYVIAQQVRAQETMDEYYQLRQIEINNTINDIVINTTHQNEHLYGIDDVYTECALLKNEYTAQVWLSVEYPYIVEDKEEPMFNDYLLDSQPLVSLSNEIIACDGKIQDLLE